MAGLSSRSAVAIHALAMLAHRRGGSLTSAEIADSLDRNPVLMRRILGRLRDAHLVWSTEGRGTAGPLLTPHGTSRSMTRTPPSRRGRSSRGTPIRPAGPARSDATSALCLTPSSAARTHKSTVTDSATVSSGGSGVRAPSRNSPCARVGWQRPRSERQSASGELSANPSGGADHDTAPPPEATAK